MCVGGGGGGGGGGEMSTSSRRRPQEVVVSKSALGKRLGYGSEITMFRFSEPVPLKFSFFLLSFLTIYLLSKCRFVA